jgi:hypothetical protein
LLLYSFQFRLRFRLTLLPSPSRVIWCRGSFGFFKALISVLGVVPSRLIVSSFFRSYHLVSSWGSIYRKSSEASIGPLHRPQGNYSSQWHHHSAQYNRFFLTTQSPRPLAMR